MAYDFDGTGYIRNTANMPTSDTVWTASFWLNADDWDFQTTHVLMQLGPDAESDSSVIQLYVADNGTNAGRPGIWNGSGTSNSSNNLGENQWYHICMRCNGTTNALKVFIDGVEDFTHNGVSHSPARWSIGCYRTTSKMFNGQMHNFKIYDVALSDEEIVKDMYSPLPIRPNSEVLAHLRWDKPGSALVDYSGNGNWTDAGTSGSITTSVFPYQIHRQPGHRIYIPASGNAYTLTGASGAYTYSGAIASLLRGEVLDSESGSYTYSGTAASLLYGFLMDAGSGSYTYTGTAAELLRGEVLDATAGAYTYSGTNAGLLADAVVVGDSGSYTYTGTAAALSAALAADSAGYVYSGTTIGLVRALVFDAETASYVYTGTSVTLTYADPSAVVSAKHMIDHAPQRHMVDTPINHDMVDTSINRHMVDPGQSSI